MFKDKRTTTDEKGSRHTVADTESVPIDCTIESIMDDHTKE